MIPLRALSERTGERAGGRQKKAWRTCRITVAATHIQVSVNPRERGPFKTAVRQVGIKAKETFIIGKRERTASSAGIFRHPESLMAKGVTKEPTDEWKSHSFVQTPTPCQTG